MDLPFAIRAFLARVIGASVSIIRVAVGLLWSVFAGLGEVGSRVASKFCDAMVLLGNDLVDDPFAGHVGRIAAGEDGSEHGVQLREVKRDVVSDDNVWDDDFSGLELAVGESNFV